MRKLGGVAELAVQPTVVINELVAKNVSGLLDTDEVGEHPDWIELYNPTAAAIHLGGMVLTDDPNNLLRYRIPDGVTIGAHSFLIFVADGEPEQGPLHTNFKLNRSSEFVRFYAPTAQGLRPLDAIVLAPCSPTKPTGAILPTPMTAAAGNRHPRQRRPGRARVSTNLLADCDAHRGLSLT